MPTGPARRVRIACAAVLLLTILSVLGCGHSDPGAASTTGTTVDPALDTGVVRTLAGSVRGLVAPGYLSFRGIPYAAPPTGEQRFRPPQPVAHWDGVRDASKPGPRCIQDTSVDPGIGSGDSEDCLSVNVFSPTGASARPVMVWIHGGAFVNGSGNLYDAHRLAVQGDIVVVTLNYRLGALGFLAHPALGPPGNYGLADQQAALRWVRDNIGGFGGDPSKVTIAGESAGAMSVCDHLVAPGSAGLFRAAIIQSGPCQAQVGTASAQQTSLTYATWSGCPDPAVAAACLRALPAAKLEKPPWYFHIGDDGLSGPVTGTRELPVDPVIAFGNGNPARVPVLIGTNHDEFTLFAATEYLKHNRAPSAAEYPGELAATFGADAASIGRRYPLDKYGGSVPLAYSAAVTDGVFACVADRMAEDLAPAAPVYAYEFNDRNAPAPELFRHLPFPIGASHALEVRYLFDVAGAAPMDPAQERLSDVMIGYWSQFVSTGVPTRVGLTEWPTVNGQSAPARS